MMKIQIYTSVLLLTAMLCGCGEQPAETASAPAQTNNAAAKTMHPSWDLDQNGINDCENDGRCDHSVDYSQPRQTEARSNPSFSCDDVAQDSIEQLICQQAELAELDNQLATVYASAVKKAENQQPNMLPAEQRGWIKGRNDCWKNQDKAGCVKAAYNRRIAELQAHYQLTNFTGPVRFQCGTSVADEVVVTFFSTVPPTLLAERGDKTVLMYHTETGSGYRYEGPNESLWQQEDGIMLIWGYGAAALQCQKTVLE